MIYFAVVYHILTLYLRHYKRIADIILVILTQFFKYLHSKILLLCLMQLFRFALTASINLLYDMAMIVIYGNGYHWDNSNGESCVTLHNILALLIFHFEKNWP